MAETNQKVMALVESEIRKNPKVSNEELFEKARKVDKNVADLSRRQFHARYPLQVRRGFSLGGRAAAAPRQAPAKAKTAAPRQAAKAKAAAETIVKSTGGDADRAVVRRVLFQFARDVAAADDKAAVLAVMGDVDKYVDRVVEATAER